MSDKKKKREWEDDGRVIADMNIEGMHGTPRLPMRKRRTDAFGQTAQKQEPLTLTKTERRAISRGIAFAYLAVLLVFVAVMTLVALFVAKVWLA
ncbi:MAG TPA: hypothetical protein VN512_04930 [Clostridia bacterium]|nr:hypothetical protein [Clostridia bacterium]